MGFRIRILLFLSVFSILSCADRKPPELKSENGFYQIQITELAGSRTWKNLVGEQDTIDGFLPVPMNMGEFAVAPIDSLNDRDFIKGFVLNNGSSVGEVLEVQPVAVIKLLDGEKSVPLMLLLPRDKKKRLLEVKSLYELQKQCYTCKNILEDWVTNLPSHNELVFFGWQDVDKAERLLDEYAKLTQASGK